MAKCFYESHGFLAFWLARKEIIFFLCFSFLYIGDVTSVTNFTFLSTLWECNGNLGNIIGVSTAAAISSSLNWEIIRGSKKGFLKSTIWVQFSAFQFSSGIRNFLIPFRVFNRGGLGGSSLLSLIILTAIFQIYLSSLSSIDVTIIPGSAKKSIVLNCFSNKLLHLLWLSLK